MKNIITTWQFWACVAGVFALLWIVQVGDMGSILPFALFLICPLMMLFMMGKHHHK